MVESISKDSLTLEAAPTRVVATAEGRRLLHDHKPRIVQMPNDMIGGDVGHQFVTLVKALPPVNRSANAMESARSLGSAGVYLSSMAPEDTEAREQLKNEMGCCRDSTFANVANFALHSARPPHRHGGRA